MTSVVAVLSLLTLAGCGSGAASTTSAGQVAVGEFTGRTVDGKAFDSATLEGRPTVLWFWAPWCTKCRGQAPDVAAVAKRQAGSVNVVGVAGLGNNDAMRQFVSSARVGSITHLSDEAGVVWKQYEVTEQSSYVLLEADGTVVFRGYLDGDDLTRRVAELAG